MDTKIKNVEKDVELLMSEADVIIENSISKIKNEIIAIYFNIGKMIVDYKKQK